MREINQTSYSRVSVDDINRQAVENPRQLVMNSEKYYYTQLGRAADRIIEKQARIILLSGPSASGKTTTANKLKEFLIYRGVGSRVLSMDNFFKGIDHYPILEDGTADMESVKTLDMDLLNACLKELTQTGEAEFPVFDFVTQRRSDLTQHVTLYESDVLIMEGIHALNPLVTENIEEDVLFRLYLSVRTRFMKGDASVIDPKELRLTRRMVRDYLFRNYPAVQTVEYWDHVIESERVNIDPYRDDVDFKMDNTLDYEVCVWHKLLHKRLADLELSAVKEHEDMRRVVDGLQCFHELDVSIIPENSLLREFIGEEK